VGDGDQEGFLKNLGKACGMIGWDVLKYLLDLDFDRMLTPVFSEESLSRSAETGVIPHDSVP
jgi:hypothetical protein